ncbi:5830_t:CDS:2 [Scutellospora calospora]|uniref:5830_t:CDS:1 n=1 Tax=Scutellospora calospora TaxID=85575 RepID=A0ACA9JVI4_9GLOM|nr:5830_t:CDS:2 [Scutellospora calospora]
MNARICTSLHSVPGTGRKKKDDEVKLWCEMNDGLCYVYRSCIPARNEFGILGIQVAGDMMHLNILIKDDDEIHRLFHLRSVKIPVRPRNEEDVLQFAEALLLLRNIMIVNISLLFHSSRIRSERLKKRSSSSNITVTTPEHPSMDGE